MARIQAFDAKVDKLFGRAQAPKYR